MRVNLGDYVGVVFSKYCTKFGECTTDFGIGLTWVILIVYSSEGHQISQTVLSRISDQHFGWVALTESDNPCELMSISTREAIMHEFIDKKNSIVQGELDYYTYTIDRDGKIKKSKTNSSNIRVQSINRKFYILEEWE